MPLASRLVSLQQFFSVTEIDSTPFRPKRNYNRNSFLPVLTTYIVLFADFGTEKHCFSPVSTQP